MLAYGFIWAVDGCVLPARLTAETGQRKLKGDASAYEWVNRKDTRLRVEAKEIRCLLEGTCELIITGSSSLERVPPQQILGLFKVNANNYYFQACFLLFLTLTDLMTSTRATLLIEQADTMRLLKRLPRRYIFTAHHWNSPSKAVLL